jgi:hypothetical protein
MGPPPARRINLSRFCRATNDHRTYRSGYLAFYLPPAVHVLYFCPTDNVVSGEQT